MVEATAKTIHRAGPFRVIIDNSDQMLRILTQARRNAVLRDAFKNSIAFWRLRWLGRRFSDYVLRAPFNYKVTPRYGKIKKESDIPPFVWAGEFAKRAHTGRIVARASKGDVRGTVSIPGMGHLVRGKRGQMFSAKFRTVPAWEVRHMAQEFARQVESQFQKQAAVQREVQARKAAVKVAAREIRKQIRAMRKADSAKARKP